MRRAVLIVLASCRFHFDPLGDGGGSGSHVLSVHVIGPGAVVSTPAGLACTSDCSASFEGAVTLTAFPAGARDIAWQGVACTGSTCDATAPAELTVTFTGATAAANRVFVTAASYPGALKSPSDPNGVVTADAICQQTATTAGLTGTFGSFLSSITISRTAIDPLVGSRGWIRLDGQPVFATTNDITGYHGIAPFTLDETGTPLPGGAAAWLGGSGNGMPTSTDCMAFSDPGGLTSVLNLGEISVASIGGGAGCNQSLHLPCIEHGKIYDLPAFPLGRTMFTTVTGWDQSTGIAAADAQCGADATAAGLPGTFVAALATSTRSVADRAGGLTGPWRRPDGYVVAFGDLGPTLDVAMPIHADGSYSMITPGNVNAWGAASLTAPSADPIHETCRDWTSTSGADMGIQGRILAMDATWYDQTSAPCSSGVNYVLYCLEHS